MTSCDLLQHLQHIRFLPFFGCRNNGEIVKWRIYSRPFRIPSMPRKRLLKSAVLCPKPICHCSNTISRILWLSAKRCWIENLIHNWWVLSELQTRCVTDQSTLSPLWQTEQLEKNRKERTTIWKQFVDDMQHKCSRVDNTFEEKEEELREFYSDLERKLHIHN